MQTDYVDYDCSLSFCTDRDRESNQTFLWAIGLHAVILIALEPDLSTALVMIPSVIAMLLYAGINENGSCVRLSDLLFFPSSSAGGLNMKLPSWPIKTRLWQHKDGGFGSLLEPYQKERIRVFLSDNVDTADARMEQTSSTSSGRVGRLTR